MRIVYLIILIMVSAFFWYDSWIDFDFERGSTGKGYLREPWPSVLFVALLAGWVTWFCTGGGK